MCPYMSGGLMVSFEVHLKYRLNANKVGYDDRIGLCVSRARLMKMHCIRWNWEHVRKLRINGSGRRCRRFTSHTHRTIHVPLHT